MKYTISYITKYIYHYYIYMYVASIVLYNIKYTGDVTIIIIFILQLNLI